MVRQEQRRQDVLAPPAGSEPDERDRERGRGVRKVDLYERSQMAAAVDRGGVVKLAREAPVELTEEEDQEGVAADTPDQPRPACRVDPELDDDPEERDEADRKGNERGPEHEEEQRI